jgi:hypothetical protein
LKDLGVKPAPDPTHNKGGDLHMENEELKGAWGYDVDSAEFVNVCRRSGSPFHTIKSEQDVMDALKLMSTDTLIKEAMNLTITIHNAERRQNMIRNILINRDVDVHKTNVEVDPLRFMKAIE